MPLLYYWHGDNYRRDLDMGVGYHLNQGNPLLHMIEKGDSLWAFTRAIDGRYVLAAELVVGAKTINPPKYRYGRYRLWGDLKHSRYFRVEAQPSVEQIIRSLSCQANAPYLGQSFQGFAAVRRISQQDHLTLRAVARQLPLEPRARLLPEERLEAALLLGDEQAVQDLIHEEEPGIADERRHYLYQLAPKRNRDLVLELRRMYEGRCQICQWNPTDEYLHNLCHGHHMQWLSRGGEDNIANMVLICPNHHAAVHACDAHLDYADFTFDFGHRKETLLLNVHLNI